MSIFFRGDIFSFSYFKQAYCSSTFEVWTTLNLYIWSVENTVGVGFLPKAVPRKLTKMLQIHTDENFGPKMDCEGDRPHFLHIFFGSENRILSSQTVKLKQNLTFNLELHIFSHFNARFGLKDDL